MLANSQGGRRFAILNGIQSSISHSSYSSSCCSSQHRKVNLLTLTNHQIASCSGFAQTTLVSCLSALLCVRHCCRNHASPFIPRASTPPSQLKNSSNGAMSDMLKQALCDQSFLLFSHRLFLREVSTIQASSLDWWRHEERLSSQFRKHSITQGGVGTTLALSSCESQLGKCETLLYSRCTAMYILFFHLHCLMMTSHSDCWTFVFNIWTVSIVLD